jgi:hypothetical protein
MKKTRKKTRKNAAITMKSLGTVGVETGQILIIDPVHAKNPDLYELSVWATMNEKSGAEFESADTPDKFGTAVAFGDFGGDGIFEVLAMYENGEAVALMIDFKSRGWRQNGTRSAAEWRSIQTENKKRIQTVSELFKAHALKVDCSQRNIKKGLPCKCGAHETQGEANGPN